MSGLHNVLSAHSFPFVKQDRSTCRRYMCIVHWQNGEQVSRTVLILRFQLVSRGGPPGSWHATVAILAYLLVAPSNHQDWEEVYTASVSRRRLQHMPSNGGEFCSWLVRSACVKMYRSAYKAAHAHLHDVPTINRPVATTRLARSPSPIMLQNAMTESIS